MELSLASASRRVATPHRDAALSADDPGRRRTPITDLMEHNGVEHCVYGHLHGPARSAGVRGQVRGVSYHLVACDAIAFTPVQVTQVPCSSN